MLKMPIVTFSVNVTFLYARMTLKRLNATCCKNQKNQYVNRLGSLPPRTHPVLPEYIENRVKNWKKSLENLSCSWMRKYRAFAARKICNWSYVSFSNFSGEIQNYFSRSIFYFTIRFSKAIFSFSISINSPVSLVWQVYICDFLSRHEKGDDSLYRESGVRLFYLIFQGCAEACQMTVRMCCIRRIKNFYVRIIA